MRIFDILLLQSDRVPKSADRNGGQLITRSSVFKVSSACEAFPFLCADKWREAWFGNATVVGVWNNTVEKLSKQQKVTEPKADANMSDEAADEVFTWSTSEALQIAHSQSGASNCGATALLNVLTALKVPVPSISMAERAVHTNSRKYGVPASEYL